MKLNFGKYKGTLIKDVPETYLKWCIDNKAIKGKSLVCAKQKLEFPKDKFEVVVKDAIIGDGIYFVFAYSIDDAIKQVRKENHIKITHFFNRN